MQGEELLVQPVFSCSCRRDLLLEQTLCFPSWTQELQGGCEGAKRSVLVLQPETEQMWERKIRAG